MTSIPDQIKQQLDGVRTGTPLRKSDRVELVDILDRQLGFTASQLADALGVSQRQIHRDRAALRRRYQQALKDLDLVGEIHRQFQITLERMDAAIQRDDHSRVRSLAMRWGVCESFTKIGLNFQLDEIARLVEQAKARIGGDNGRPGNDPKAN